MKKGTNHYRPSKPRHRPSPAPKPVPKDNAPNPNKTTTERTENNQPSDQSLDQSMVRWTRIVGLFTGILAVVGGLQFWAFVQSERAFLSAMSLTINGGFPQAGERNIRVFFEIKNSGRTTAFPTRAVIAMRGRALPTKVEYGDEPSFAISPVAPDVVLHASDEIVLNTVITQAEIDAVKSGTLRMSFFGYIIYFDAFWLFGDMTTGFCFTYTPFPTGASQFVTCPERGYTYAK